MTYIAGVLTLQNAGSNTTQIVTTSASGGVGPYTQQWYRSTTTGFTPGSGNILTGQTGLVLNDTNLIPNTVYYYKVVYTDTGFSNDTVTSSQLAVTTIAAIQNMNQFQMSPFIGMLDLKVGTTSVFSAQVDVTQSGLLFNGSAVNVVNGPNGIPTIVASTTDSDNIAGIIVYDIKSQSYAVGARCEVAFAGSCMWLYATTAITRFNQICLDLTSPGSVQAATGTNTIIGFAFDQATSYGQLIRVILTTPSFLAN